ncbi:hypothetical protein GCM10027074_74710 [Streptomyces deserti]
MRYAVAAIVSTVAAIPSTVAVPRERGEQHRPENQGQQQTDPGSRALSCSCCVIGHAEGR